MSENLTPERYRCSIGPSCPSVHRLDDGRLLIVGDCAESILRQGTDEIAVAAYEKVYGSVEVDKEWAIVIDPGLLEEFLRCQAGDSAKGEPSSSPSAPLQSSDGGDAYFGAHGKVLRHRALEHPESPLARDLVIAAGWVDSLNYRLLQFEGQIEEPALAGDEVSAASQSASLTHPDFDKKAQEIINWNVAPGIEDFTALHSAISSALLTASKDATERAARIAEQHSGLWDPETVEAIASAIRTQESS